MEARSDQAENRKPARLESELKAWSSGSGISSALMAPASRAARLAVISNSEIERRGVRECLASVWYDEVEKSDTILVTYTIVWGILRIENSLTIREG